jgi:hypothetical protein
MSLRNFKVRVVVLAWMCIFAQSASGTEWFFFDLSNPSKNQITVTSTHVKTHPSTVPAEICTENDEFHCLDSEVLRFAIPRKLDGKKSWIYKGIAYRIHHEETISIFGQPKNLIYVDQVDPKADRMRFIFSKTHGLIGFWKSDAKARPLFVLENNCGPGASKECRDEHCTLTAAGKLECKPLK